MYNNFEYDKTLVKFAPSPRQLKVQQMEFYAFAHFGVNTFTDREWGDGTESPAIFNPTEFDANQWVDALKAAGIGGLILTCKHHDGFCLWPSAYTEHSIKNSLFQNGKGDIVREVSDACKRGGIAFGVYLSPWDRNSKLYGTDEYNDYFCNQLTELLTEYGELFTVWFDGACGEGPNGKKQVYDWERYYALIRKLQPNACIAISGPDIRWCGNEAGVTRPCEWSVLPVFNESRVNMTDQDLGSRAVLKGISDLQWRPSETDVSIRPGWFYHSYEDDKVRSTENLLDIWYRTVGGNSTLLLNIPPDKRGLFCETDVQRLEEMGKHIRQTFAKNHAENAVITADTDDGIHFPDALKNDSYDTYYKSKDGDNQVTLTIELDGIKEITHVVIKEHIPMSQRVETFAIDIKTSDASYTEIAVGTTIGYKKILNFAPIKTDTVRIRVTDSRVCPVLSFVGVY